MLNKKRFKENLKLCGYFEEIIQIALNLYNEIPESMKPSYYFLDEECITFCFKNDGDCDMIIDIDDRGFYINKGNYNEFYSLYERDKIIEKLKEEIV